MKYEKRLDKLLKEKTFTPKNKKHISGFVKTCRSKHITSQRIVFYLERLRRISEFHSKDFDKWKREDVEKVMRKVHGMDYKPWTVEAYKTTLKVFFRWLNGLDKSDPTPRLVSWLTRETPKNWLRREDLLTKEEIKQMISAEKTLLGKALISILSSGPRPSEVLSIKISDVSDEGKYIKAYVRGKMLKKTGERAIFIGFFVEGLDDIVRNWIKYHPDKRPGSKLFPGLYNENMIGIVKRASKRAGIKRKVWPYLFRHTYGTWCYGNYNSAHARRLMGHTAGSKMEGVYCHLNEDDIINVLTGKTEREKPIDIEAEDKFNKLWTKFESENKNRLKEMFIEWMKNNR